MNHKVYKTTVYAVKNGSMCEPFSYEDLRKRCTGFGEGTYKAFLYKHKKGNEGGNSELFLQVEPNKFVLIKPIKYGL